MMEVPARSGTVYLDDDDDDAAADVSPALFGSEPQCQALDLSLKTGITAEVEQRRAIVSSAADRRDDRGGGEEEESVDSSPKFGYGCRSPNSVRFYRRDGERTTSARGMHCILEYYQLSV